jgi:hypothetical protein
VCGMVFIAEMVAMVDALPVSQPSGENGERLGWHGRHEVC